MGNSKEQPGGEELISELVTATGLPEPLIHDELQDILDLGGHSAKDLTLDQLRSAMIAYLESVHRDVSADDNN
jgi:hypothetical protein